MSSKIRFHFWFRLRHLALQPLLEPADASCRRRLCDGQYVSGFAIPGCTLGPEDCAEQGRTPGCNVDCGPQSAGWEVQREECVRGRQEASQSLPSLALGLKEINCVL